MYLFPRRQAHTFGSEMRPSNGDKGNSESIELLS